MAYAPGGWGPIPLSRLPEKAIWAAQLYLFSPLRWAPHGVYTVEDWSVPLTDLG